MPHILMVSIKELTLVLDGSRQNSTRCCSPTVTDTVRLLPCSSPRFALYSVFPALHGLTWSDSCVPSSISSVDVFPQCFSLIATLSFPACETSAALFQLPICQH